MRYPSRYPQLLILTFRWHKGRQWGEVRCTR